MFAPLSMLLLSSCADDLNPIDRAPLELPTSPSSLEEAQQLLDSCLLDQACPSWIRDFASELETSSNLEYLAAIDLDATSASDLAGDPAFLELVELVRSVAPLGTGTSAARQLSTDEKLRQILVAGVFIALGAAAVLPCVHNLAWCAGVVLAVAVWSAKEAFAADLVDVDPASVNPGSYVAPELAEELGLFQPSSGTWGGRFVEMVFHDQDEFSWTWGPGSDDPPFVNVSHACRLESTRFSCSSAEVELAFECVWGKAVDGQFLSESQLTATVDSFDVELCGDSGNFPYTLDLTRD